MSALVLLVSAQLLCAAPPSSVEEAEIAFAALRYDHAEGMAKLALTEPDSTENERARAHRVLGQLAAIRGNPTTAEQHFLRMLQADRSVVVEERASPKIRGPFEAARDRLPPPGEGPPPEDEPPPPTVEPETETETETETSPPAATTATVKPPVRAADGDDGDDALVWGLVGAAAVGVVVGLVGVGVLAAVLVQQDPCAGNPSCVTPP